jgi:hypothetical protein
MTFTWGEDLSVARDYVRFRTGDTVEDQSFLSDELIASLISEEGSNDKAVLAAFDYIIRRLSQPNFRADWLQVDYKTAREGYEREREKFAAAIGYGMIATNVTHTYRADSAQTETPDYTDGRP